MIYKSSPVWTIKSKHSYHQQPSTPSPNVYTPKTNITLSKSPSWKLGRQARLTDNYKHTPSPNQYHPNIDYRSYKNGKFQSAQKLKHQINKVPGPGSYNITMKQNNHANLFNKYQEIKIINIDFPGPGKYMTRNSQLNKKGIKITKQKRFVTQPNQLSPGPGQYNCQGRNNSPSISFSKAARINDNNCSQDKKQNQGNNNFFYTTPGPGQYSPTNISFHASPSITINGKYKPRQNDRTPSPTDYSPKYQKIVQKVSSYSIGKGQRPPLFSKSRSPGPAQYVNNDDKFQNKCSIKFTKQTRKTQHKDIPGPGAYTPKHQVYIKRPKSAKIGKSLRFLTPTQFYPSPLQYNPHQQKYSKTSQYSFSRGKRMTQKRASSPGPGAYNICSSISHNSSYVWK